MQEVQEAIVGVGHITSTPARSGEWWQLNLLHRPAQSPECLPPQKSPPPWTADRSLSLDHYELTSKILHAVGGDRLDRHVTSLGFERKQRSAAIEVAAQPGGGGVGFALFEIQA